MGISSAWADTSAACGSSPEAWVCKLEGADPEFSRVEQARAKAYNDTKYSVMMRGFAAARKLCGLTPDNSMGSGDPLQVRYIRAFDNEFSLERRFCSMKAMQTEVERELKSRGLLMVETELGFNRIRNMLLAEINETAAFSEQDKERISTEVTATKLISALTYTDEIHWMRGEVPHSYAYACPIDLRPSAYLNYSFNSFELVAFKQHAHSKPTLKRIPTSRGTPNFVIACPGLFLELLNTTHPDRFTTWARIIGHELGHNFHAFLIKDTYVAKSKTYSQEEMKFIPTALASETHLFDRYNQYSSCLKSNYENHENVADRMMAKSPDQEWLSHFTYLQGTPADQLQGHLAEASAEYWGIRTLARFALSNAEVSAERSVYDGLKLLCPKRGQEHTMTSDTAGTHPSLAHRLRMAVREPRIRAALQCAPTPENSPWCSL